MYNQLKSNPSKNIKVQLVGLIALMILSSCNSYKEIPYFQDLSRSQVTSEDLTNFTPLTIQPRDQISINVGSLNPEAAAVFTNNLQNSGTNTENPTFGYLVNQQGEVSLPLVGTMKVSGLTTDEMSSQLQKRLLTYLKEPTVSIRVVNFKVAVLGDVMRPNVYRGTEGMTVTEALSLAGDLNITAKRNDIVLVRERNGKREYFPIDLTTKNVFTSPHFYLKNNDLIFVQPSKLKLANVDTGYRNASLVISALSLLAITYSILK